MRATPAAALRCREATQLPCGAWRDHMIHLEQGGLFGTPGTGDFLTSPASCMAVQGCSQHAGAAWSLCREATRQPCRHQGACAACCKPLEQLSADGSQLKQLCPCLAKILGIRRQRAPQQLSLAACSASKRQHSHCAAGRPQSPPGDVGVREQPGGTPHGAPGGCSSLPEPHHGPGGQ